MSYPVWRYHKTLMPYGKIIHDEAEDKSLGEGWVDTPAKFDCEEIAPQSETMTQEEADKAIESGEAVIPEEAVIDIDAMKEVLKKNGFTANQLKKKTDEEIVKLFEALEAKE